MSDLPPPPEERKYIAARTPKKQSWKGPVIVFASVALFLAGLGWLGATGGGGEQLDPFDRAALVIAEAVAAEDSEQFADAMTTAKTLTGCTPVTGAREITKEGDAEQAKRKAVYIKSLESSGLEVGEADVQLPEGTMHQVVGFKC